MQAGVQEVMDIFGDADELVKEFQAAKAAREEERAGAGPLLEEDDEEADELLGEDQEDAEGADLPRRRKVRVSALVSIVSKGVETLLQKLMFSMKVRFVDRTMTDKAAFIHGDDGGRFCGDFFVLHMLELSMRMQPSHLV